MKIEISRTRGCHDCRYRYRDYFCKLRCLLDDEIEIDEKAMKEDRYGKNRDFDPDYIHPNCSLRNEEDCRKRLAEEMSNNYYLFTCFNKAKKSIEAFEGNGGETDER